MNQMSLLDQAAEVRARAKAARQAAEDLRRPGEEHQWPLLYAAAEDAEGAARTALQAAWRQLDHLTPIALNTAKHHAADQPENHS